MLTKLRSYGSNMAQAYRLARGLDRAIGAKLIAMAIVGIALIYLGGSVIGPAVMWWLLGLPMILLPIAYYFGRTAEAGAYASVEGQPGAAAAVLQSLKSGWFTTPAVAFNRNQDLVHRVVNRRGVILISEGPASRVGTLLANERKRTQRFVGETPILEIQSGREAGQVPLPRLTKHLKKLPKKMTAPEVTEMRRRLEALGGPQNAMPIPKGPMPRSAKAARAVRR